MITIKKMKAAMKQLYKLNDDESYDTLWKAIQVLNNLGVLDRKFVDAMIEEDHRLFEENNQSRGW